MIALIASNHLRSHFLQERRAAKSATARRPLYCSTHEVASRDPRSELVHGNRRAVKAMTKTAVSRVLAYAAAARDQTPLREAAKHQRPAGADQPPL